MKKTGIFYGSTTGTTESIARKIAFSLGMEAADVRDVASFTVADAASYEVLLLGTSTWGSGELQDDWYGGIEVLKSMNLQGKTVALFGCGDSSCYADTFCDGMGLLYRELEGAGCRFCGSVEISDYNFEASRAVINGRFVGLALDEANESDKTEVRIKNWVEKLKEECADN